MLEMLRARKEALQERGVKGFTLMEMLIVIAIIAILIAIAIPIFSDQLERANEATDAANLRSAYATASASLLTTNSNADGVSAKVNLKQKDSFDKLNSSEKIGNFELNGQSLTGDVYVNVAKDGTVSIDTTKTTGYVEVDPISGAAVSNPDPSPSNPS